MCGIIGRVGAGDSTRKLVRGLQNLEYRGYDSAGVAVQNGTGIKVRKCEGRVEDLREELRGSSPVGNAGIGHTRWSTHGPPSDANAHPHTDESSNVAVVHNGVIDNYERLREELTAEGVEFSSDTDTEVVPHLVQRYLDRGADPEAAFREAVDDIEGSYALAVLVEDEERIFAARDGSPLVIGFDEDERYLASDVPAFVEYTDRVTYLEDGDVAVLSPWEVRVTDVDGTPVDRAVETVDWDAEEAGRGSYDHYMLKEIHTQPTALANTVEGRIRSGTSVDLDALDRGAFEGVDHVHLVGCGTSHHAGLFGATLLRRMDVRATAMRANEYDTAAGPIDGDTLVVAVTQSGETADTLSAVETATAAGARTLAVTNVVGSSVTRCVDDALFIRAGPEIGVAATKTFTSQAVTLALLAERLADDVPGGTSRDDRERLLDDLGSLPDDVASVLERSRAGEVAREYLDSEAFFFIGRGTGTPVAREGALKFKEITYEHAEGFASGELKHGPLALVSPETPIVAVATGDEEQDRKTYQNAKEAQARGAPVVGVGPATSAIADLADDHLRVPDVQPVPASLLANVQLQLLSYHAAARLDRPIDKPRNLAKSVTVE